MKYGKYFFLIAVPLLFHSCCTLKKCSDDNILVVPYTDGIYVLPTGIVERHYFVLNGDYSNKQSWIRQSPVNCESDTGVFKISCCSKNTIELWVSFKGQITEDKKLSTVEFKTPSQISDCIVIDVDPDNNSPNT